MDIHIALEEKLDGCLCDKCYDETIIECTECNIKYELLFKSNKHLLSLDGESEMKIRNVEYLFVLIVLNVMIPLKM